MANMGKNACFDQLMIFFNSNPGDQYFPKSACDLKNNQMPKTKSAVAGMPVQLGSGIIDSRKPCCEDVENGKQVKANENKPKENFLFFS